MKIFRRHRIHVPDSDKLADGEARKVSMGDPNAGGMELLVCRVKGEVFAIETLCPHEGGRLVPGPLAEGKYALCPLHNYRFDPATGKPIGASCPKARVFKAREQDNAIEILI